MSRLRGFMVRHPFAASFLLSTLITPLVLLNILLIANIMAAATAVVVEVCG